MNRKTASIFACALVAGLVGTVNAQWPVPQIGDCMNWSSENTGCEAGIFEPVGCPAMSDIGTFPFGQTCGEHNSLTIQDDEWLDVEDEGDYTIETIYDHDCQTECSCHEQEINGVTVCRINPGDCEDPEVYQEYWLNSDYPCLISE